MLIVWWVQVAAPSLGTAASEGPSRSAWPAPSVRIHLKWLVHRFPYLRLLYFQASFNIWGSGDPPGGVYVVLMAPAFCGSKSCLMSGGPPPPLQVVRATGKSGLVLLGLSVGQYLTRRLVEDDIEDKGGRAQGAVIPLLTRPPLRGHPGVRQSIEPINVIVPPLPPFFQAGPWPLRRAAEARRCTRGARSRPRPRRAWRCTC